MHTCTHTERYNSFLPFITAIATVITTGNFPFDAAMQHAVAHHLQVYMYVCMYVRMYVCCTYKHMSGNKWNYTGMYMYVCMYVCVCIYVCMYMYVCMYVCAYVHVCVLLYA